MRKFIVFVLILLASVIFGVKIAQDPGYALFVYRQWMVELPLWLAIVIFFIFFALFYCFMNGLSALHLWFNRVKFWSRSRQIGKSYHALCLGVIDSLEGKYKSAERHLTYRAEESDTALVNYLLAASAAHEQGEYKKRDHYFELAEKSNLKASVALGITQAQLKIKQKQFLAAQVLLKRLYEKSPKQYRVLELLLEASVQLGDWSLIKTLLPKIKKLPCYSVEKYHALLQQMYAHELNNQSESGLINYWDAMPKAFRKQEDLIVIYVNRLTAMDNLDQAQAVLQTALRHEFSAKLVSLYAEIKGDSHKQYKQVCQWQKSHSSEPALHAALANLALREKLWGQAREHFEQSLKLEKNAKVYCQFAEFLASQGEIQTALHYYKLAFEKV